jgi:molecular chaperone HscC
MVLRGLKEDAEAFFKQPVDRAVITVPAYFNDQQRKATIHAGQIAGLQVERILNEPTAAALAYGLHEADRDRVLLVIDLGGGTFDVSVVDVFEGTVEVRSSAGESFLGGQDFTLAVAARLLRDQKIVFEAAEAKYPHMVSRLLQQVEVAKCALSRQETATVRIPDKRGKLSVDSPQIELQQAQVAEWTEPILARIEMPIRRALGDAGLKREQLDEIILVGGATRMRHLVARVTKLFGQVPHCRLNPDEVVARGAAVQAGLFARNAELEDLVVTDVSPFTLGVEVSKELGSEQREGYFLPIINRNTTIPVSRMERVSTVHAGQTNVCVRVYQGESRRVEDNLYLGEFTIDGIPRGPAGQPVDLRFTYDLNGVLEIEATVVKTGRKYTHVIAKHAKGLSPKEIEAAIAAMQKLKTHPREESVNRFLLRRAGRLYEELSLTERQRLGDMLDGFEAALSEGDPAVIDEFRAALEELLAFMEGGLYGEQDNDQQIW